MQAVNDGIQWAWRAVVDTSWVWLPVLQAGLAIAGLFLSKPERFKVAAALVTGICLLSVWQMVEGYQQQRTTSAIQQRAYSRLMSDTDRFVRLISQIVYFSSPDWLPETPDQLLSSRTTDIMCSWLDLEADAPVIPRRLWWQWIATETAAFEAALSRSVAEYGAHLDADTIQRIQQIERAATLQHWKGLPSTYASRAELKIQVFYTLCGHELQPDTVQMFEVIRQLRERLVQELTAYGAAPHPNSWREPPPGSGHRQGKDRIRRQ